MYPSSDFGWAEGARRPADQHGSPVNTATTSRSNSGLMSQASSSTARNRLSSRVVHQPRTLAVVHDVAPLAATVDLVPVIDEVSKLPLIMCPECTDVRVFAATMTQSQYNNGKRFFKCPRKNYGKCHSYWFEEEYVVFLRDNGYLPSALTMSEVPEAMEKTQSLEQNLNKLKEMVGANRDDLGSCICLVCGCVNVTLFLLLAIVLVAVVVFK